ncbi:hypothetical protein ACFC09_01160 [Streptomyces sp. NPDC056161]|uniref:hypothetical protein n=1 Tax=Streptomyces sp. NPDC056161 TaxID=3345732 RepID=UPI0035E11234
MRRISEQVQDDSAASAPAEAQVGGRGVLLVPARGPCLGQDTLPPDYQRILAAVAKVGGPVATRQVGEALGMDLSARGSAEPLRGKLIKLAERGWLRKLSDGRFTARP